MREARLTTDAFDAREAEPAPLPELHPAAVAKHANQWVGEFSPPGSMSREVREGRRLALERARDTGPEVEIYVKERPKPATDIAVEEVEADDDFVDGRWDFDVILSGRR